MELGKEGLREREFLEENMKNSFCTFFFFIFFVAVFLITSCTLFNKEATQEIPAGVETSSSEAETYLSCLDRCASCETTCEDSLYYTKALAEENKNVCERITSTILQQECTKQLLAVEAVAELNKDKCMLLGDEDIQRTCLDNVAAEIAVQSSSVEKCADAPHAERCENHYYREMAVLSSDASYCDNLEEEQKQLCVEAVQISATTEE